MNYLQLLYRHYNNFEEFLHFDVINLYNIVDIKMQSYSLLNVMR